MERHRDIMLTRRNFLRAATAAGLIVTVNLLEACARSAITPTPAESSRATAAPTSAMPTSPPTVASATAAITPLTISQAAAAYLKDALDYIEQNSVMRDRVDWQQLREDATTLTHDAQTTADTYPAIRYILQQLDNVPGSV